MGYLLAWRSNNLWVCCSAGLEVTGGNDHKDRTCEKKCVGNYHRMKTGHNAVLIAGFVGVGA